MNILFLTLYQFNSIKEHNIYPDLLREFLKHGHHVYTISPIERRNGQKTYLVQEENSIILRLRIGNTQKTNIAEKGISTVLIEPAYIQGIKKYFSGVKFDLMLYSTPPITLCSAIEYVKKRDGAKTYLLLKDIFPQNSVDLGMLAKDGIIGILYRYFRRKEKRLYSLSDYIGCMSPANVEYLLENNKEISPEKVEVCPNSVEPIDLSVSDETRRELRKKYNIPSDKCIFVYGGNLGKPQGIDFLIECLKACDQENAYFVIVGNGTEYPKVQAYVEQEKPESVKLLPFLPKEDYDKLIASCDVGLIFLDYRFTIPNFPSRLLPYMQAKLPVLVASDVNSDMGRIAEENQFGVWCRSDSVRDFTDKISLMLDNDRVGMGLKGYRYLLENYTVEVVCQIILKANGGKV